MLGTTSVTRLAENPAVAEETIRQLAGHISPRMLARCAHIRLQARRAAIATLEPRAETASLASSEGDSRHSADNVKWLAPRAGFEPAT